jgi:hypothetical protein
MCLLCCAKFSRAFPPKKCGIDAPPPRRELRAATSRHSLRTLFHRGLAEFAAAARNVARFAAKISTPVRRAITSVAAALSGPRAYMEGNIRGPSSPGGEKSFLGTSSVSAARLARANASLSSTLIQIQKARGRSSKPLGQRSTLLRQDLKSELLERRPQFPYRAKPNCLEAHRSGRFHVRLPVIHKQDFVRFHP